MLMRYYLRVSRRIHANRYVHGDSGHNYVILTLILYLKELWQLLKLKQVTTPSRECWYCVLLFVDVCTTLCVLVLLFAIY